MAGPSPRSAGGDRHRLKYACDGGILSSAHLLDEEDSINPQSSECDSCDSTDESIRLNDLSAGFRVFSDWFLRTELAEAEMIKAIEASRCESEKRRLETEAEMTRMLLRTQSQIASYVTGESRKRKRVEQDDSRDSASKRKREGALLLSLIHCNLIF